jgi:hypothetical protein
MFLINFLCVTSINNVNADNLDNDSDNEVFSSNHACTYGVSSQSFGDCLCLNHQRLMTSSLDDQNTVSETWDITSISILTGPIAREGFIAFSRRENLKPYCHVFRVRHL